MDEEKVEWAQGKNQAGVRSVDGQAGQKLDQAGEKVEHAQAEKRLAQEQGGQKVDQEEAGQKTEEEEVGQ